MTLRLLLLSAATTVAIDIATIDRDNSPKVVAFVHTRANELKLAMNHCLECGEKSNEDKSVDSEVL